MRRLRFLASVIILVSLSSCGLGEPRTEGSKRRSGGLEIAAPAGGFRAVAGQTVYVPVYSSIYTADNPDHFPLAVTLSIRNTDREKPVVVTSVRYYDHRGKLVREFLKRPLQITSMAAVELFVSEGDTSGGVSASFLVEWLSEQAVSSPVVESVMIGTGSTQGISFTSSGRVLSDRSRAEPGTAQGPGTASVR
ncbi:MAG TPA: DUF3124 domain-containing protein [Isosphaeraceae bacterium]|nr:DUF3124 domain-containing protein [Isosphaeraceae bacterium]